MVRAKKSLGQNWLKSESAIKEIIKAGDLKAREWVLEIGPGRGILTRELLASRCKVLAVEKDDRLIEYLREKFADKITEKKLILIHDDILKLNFSALFSSLNPTPHILLPTYKLITNIPYYITGQIIRKFLSKEEKQPSRMVLMVQKEVAKRIVANDKKESLLSISVKVYGEPRYIKTVPAGAFEPKPKVDSAILLIANVSRNFFRLKPGLGKNTSEQEFFAILKKGFAQKRKLLKGNLGVGEEVLQTCQIPVKTRAENLTLKNWKCLARLIKVLPPSF